METVAAHATRAPLRGYRVMHCRGRQAVVEGGVEHRDVRSPGQQLHAERDAEPVGRVVQRRQRIEARELRERGRIHARRRQEALAAMHHAVPDGDDGVLVRDGCERLRQRGAVIRGTGRTLADLLDLARGNLPLAAHVEHAELQRGTAAVDHQDVRACHFGAMAGTTGAGLWVAIMTNRRAAVQAMAPGCAGVVERCGRRRARAIPPPARGPARPGAPGRRGRPCTSSRRADRRNARPAAMEPAPATR